MDGFDDFTNPFAPGGGFDSLADPTNFGLDSLGEDNSHYLHSPIKKSSDLEDNLFRNFGGSGNTRGSHDETMSTQLNPQQDSMDLGGEPVQQEEIRGKRPAGRPPLKKPRKTPAAKKPKEEDIDDDEDSSSEAEKPVAKKGRGPGRKGRKKTKKPADVPIVFYNGDEDDFIMSDEESSVDNLLEDDPEDDEGSFEEDMSREKPKKAPRKKSEPKKRKRANTDEGPTTKAQKPNLPPKSTPNVPYFHSGAGAPPSLPKGLVRPPLGPPQARPPSDPRMAPPMGGEPGARPFGAGDDAMRNDLQFHMQVQHAAARVLANVERRLNQNDVLLQLMQQKNETYTMIDLILRFRFNADHALAELEQLPVRFGGRGFLPPLVNPRNFSPRDPKYIPRTISSPMENNWSEEQRKSMPPKSHIPRGSNSGNFQSALLNPNTPNPFAGPGGASGNM